jgi:hypothetical protein
VLVHSEFLVLDHKNVSGGHLWSTDGACASGATKSIWKVPKSYGGRSTMVGSETECECGPSSALQQLPRVASAASTRLCEYGAPSSYVKSGMCHRSPHPSTREKKLSEHYLVRTILRHTVHRPLCGGCSREWRKECSREWESAVGGKSLL